ncbi:MAG: 30S ribosomal protein S5 [Candidatus Kaiserbacteria bacterium]|nr:30S ribosomal protein S5 [Candidatus Kaiserbacteria bacterium]
MEEDTRKAQQETKESGVNEGGADSQKKENTQKPQSERRGGGRGRERQGQQRGGRNDKDGRGKKRRSAFGRSGKGRGGDRQKSEFETRVLSARRVSRVVAGGRRFSLSVAVAVGNRKGRVGIGTGKGIDMAAAMEKARNQAQKNMVEVQITNEKSIPSEAVGKYCASVVHIRPSRGFVAGGAVRTIAELAGVERINAKIQSRSKCHLNNARATLKAFSVMSG